MHKAKSIVENNNWSKREQEYSEIRIMRRNTSIIEIHSICYYSKNKKLLFTAYIVPFALQPLAFIYHFI